MGYRLFQDHVWPRKRLLICSWQFLSALIISIVITIFIPRINISDLKAFDLATAGFTFASIALSGCFTATVLVISLPGENRIQRWSSAAGEIATSSAYLDLVFVLIWAGLCQIGLILVCVLALLFGGDNLVWAENAPNIQRVPICGSALLFFYSLNELVTVIQTLFRVSFALIWEERDVNTVIDQGSSKSF